MIHLAICDDACAETEYLTSLVRDWATARDASVLLSAFESAEQFMFAYEADRAFDILLLDIQMKDMDGVTLARRVRRENEAVQIVFVTGYPDFIAEGYDVAALHYLIKPVKREKLFEVLDRAVRRLLMDEAILIETENGAVRVSLNEIESVETFDHRLELSTLRERISVKMPLYALEKMLTDHFVRCHRCCMVNMRFVKKITRTEVLLDSGRTLPLSRRLYADVNRSMLRYVKGDGE